MSEEAYLHERDQEVKVDLIQGLRDLADWLEATPSAPASYHTQITAFADTKEHAQAVAREGGNTEKEYGESYFRIIKKFGDTVRYHLAVERNIVCTKKVLGTELKEVPDYTNVPKVTKEVEIVEWECDPLLKPTEA